MSSFCCNGRSGGNLILGLAVASLGASFYFSSNSDANNAIFFCGASAILFGISCFMDRMSFKNILQRRDMDDSINDLHVNISDIHDTISKLKSDMRRECNDDIQTVWRGIDDVEKRIDNEMENLNVCTKKVCKKEILNEG